MIIRVATFLLSLLASGHYTYGQSGVENAIVKKLNTYQRNTLQEKVFVHLDRTFYVGGETMWMKVYVMDGYEHRPMTLSKVVYVDVLDRNLQPVLQTKISIENGYGNGSVQIPASLGSDNYTVRAYTSWMKNFSADFYFHQAISIVNVFQRPDEKNKTIDTKLDVQFFPEGGNLIDGIKSKVAFRVVDFSGNGIAFSGAVLNSKGDTVVMLTPVKFGIGHFKITPKTEENYQVVIKEINGNVTRNKLPSIQLNGYTLMVTDTSENRVKIQIRRKDNNSTSDQIYVVGHTREIVKSASLQNLNAGEICILINKKELGEGIVHFTVFDQHFQPVCERLYFNRPLNTLPLVISSDKINYEPRSKIILQTSIKSDLSIDANASLSVFKNDSLQQFNPADIQSYLWLTSELKGNIESPEYYFSNNILVDQAMDNLMLTHGWSRIKWNEVLQPSNKMLTFLPEYRGHIITGKVIDISSLRSVQGIPAYLSVSGKRIHPYLTYSNVDGRVIFETNHLFGSRQLITQTGPSQNTTRLEIESPFSEAISSTTLPYLKLKENLKGPLTLRSISMQTEDMFYRGRVKNQPQTSDSSAFYGNASEQYQLDEYTRFPAMEEVIREYVKGVRLRKKDDEYFFKVLNGPENYIFENGPFVLLDGVPVFNTTKIMEMDPFSVSIGGVSQTDDIRRALLV